MYEKVKKIIAESEVVLVFAGAGMSADSGLATYQDTEGFYKEYPLYKELNKSYVSMMSYDNLFSDPYFAWGYFAHQYRLYESAIPHDGYRALLELCQSKEDYFVVTTNVDGLFTKAGFPEEKVHEVHGTIHRLQCSLPCHREVWETKGISVEIDYTTMKAKDHLPLCPKCGHVSRPNICMYGDTDESYIWEEAEKGAKRFRDWKEKYVYKKVLIFEIGVGVEGLKRHLERLVPDFKSVKVVRINPESAPCEVEKMVTVSLGANEVLTELIEENDGGFGSGFCK